MKRKLDRAFKHYKRALDLTRAIGARTNTSAKLISRKVT
jgi:hypothetical protein